MQCDQCAHPIDPDEERQLHGRPLCEDCYLDALSTTRTCDPWAVHSAKRLAESSPGLALSPLQEKILAVLKGPGKMFPEEVCRLLGISRKELEQEFASLRHMEKIRAEKIGDQIILHLW